jgi:hypothetical protein
VNALAKRTVDGWSVAMDGDEPTILDGELGERLGFARPRDIRKLIERLAKDGKLNNLRIRATVARIELRRGVHRDQVVNEYWLTEAQSLKVIAKSDTDIADKILDQVIAVFIAVRRGQMAAPEQVPVLSSSPLVGDSHLRAELSARCAMSARCLAVGIHRVHGFVRRQFRVPGIYQLPVVLYPMARDLLESLALGRLMLPATPSRRLTAAANPAQGMLAFSFARPS